MAVAIKRRQGSGDEILLISSSAASGSYKIWQASYNFSTQAFTPLSTPIPAVTARHAVWIEMYADDPESGGNNTLVWTVGGTSQSYYLNRSISRETTQLLFWNTGWKDKALSNLATDIRYTETPRRSWVTPLRNKNATIKMGYY